MWPREERDLLITLDLDLLVVSEIFLKVGPEALEQDEPRIVRGEEVLYIFKFAWAGVKPGIFSPLGSA